MFKNDKLLYWRARWAVKRKRHRIARRHISQLLKNDPHNDDAWVLAAAVTSDPEKKNDYLKLALRLNLDNEEANRAYREIDPTAFTISILTSRKQRIAERINRWRSWHFIGLFFLLIPIYVSFQNTGGLNESRATPIWTTATRTPVAVPGGARGEITSTQLISVGLDGNPANGNSREVDVSADGDVIAFASTATNLVADDTNEATDVFVHIRSSRKTIRVSVTSDGEEGNASSFDPAISANGRYVAFSSTASNLVENDENNSIDVFVMDIETMELNLVSLGPESNQLNGFSKNPDISADGRFVTFISNADNAASDSSYLTSQPFQVILFDRETNQGHIISK